MKDGDVILEINIVEYEASYAAKVADMWNHSRDGWGGANTVDTEETIRNREASSTNIHTYLALEGDLVVGYCGLSEYRDDEGALYIPLLNVRDDYHGKKIGKKLLLTAIKKTIELGWPRLDLYTWPGNTKAVPLYKKCGFFWEERDDTTHLMNFIPTVLGTEAVKNFFVDADWYEHSSRIIEVKPDGKVENDFHYYEYTWEKPGSSLRIEFERTGRGIRLIETDDYFISATVPTHPLVFGNQYEVSYTIKNKSGKPLYIDLAGESDQNIDYSFEKSLHVIDDTVVTGTFYIHPVEEEQNSDRTHPTVQTLVKINGKEANFKTGILPKFPAQVGAHFTDDLTFIGKEYVFYLDLMNNYSEEVRFEMNFPASSLLEMKQPYQQIDMEAKQRKSIAFPFTVNTYGFYDADLKITAIKENGEEVAFSKNIGIPLRGIGSAFHGEDENSLQLYNGQYFVELNRQGNEIQLGRKKKQSKLVLMEPKVGKPYSEEMTRLTYENVSFFEDTGVIGTKITYQLKAQPYLKLHIILKLYGEGLAESYYEIENVGNEETEPVWVNQPIYLHLDDVVLPYHGEIITLHDSIGNDYEYWDDAKLTENWLFIEDAAHPIGVTWNKEVKIQFESWYHYFEHNLGKLKANGSLQTPPVTFSIGAFHDVESFQEFATQSTMQEKLKPISPLRLSLENNNPFVKGENVRALVTDYKSNYLHGELGLSISSGKEKSVALSFHREEQKTECKAELDLKDIPSISTVKLKAKLDAAIQERETLVIRQTTADFTEEVIQEHGLDVWQFNNGYIQLKASPEFYPSLYSLMFQGKEWLHTSFPTLEPKLWWNPWSGGLSSRLSATRPHSISKEKTVAAFAGKTDNKGNEWRGIKLTTSIEKNEECKGLTYHQYFLLLQGAPVVCHVTEIDQITGKYFNGNEWQTTAFFKAGENIEDNWISVQDKAGEWTKVVAGKDENDLKVARNLIIGCDKNEHHLQLISDTNNTTRMGYVNKQVVLAGVSERLTMPTATNRFTIPNFYVFHDRVIHDHAQHDLQKIRFE